MKQTPRLLVSGLTNTVWIVTRYTEHHRTLPDGQVADAIEASEKFDVTDDFVHVATELGWTPPEDVTTFEQLRRGIPLSDRITLDEMGVGRDA